MSSLSLEGYAHELVQDVLASAEADVTSAHDAFAERAIAELEVAGTIDDAFVSYYRAHAIEVSGYGFNEALGTLDLFVMAFRQHPLMAKMGKADVVSLAKRATTFAEKANKILRDQIDESSDAYDMCLGVEELLPTAQAIRVFVVTNDVATVKALSASVARGLPVSYEIWDLKRLHRLAMSGVQNEPITVTFDEPLPCLSTPTTDEDYSVLLSIIPGRALGEIYREFGTRLLELNVRSFLQNRGLVNRGIRETLLYAPERFLAYNNGISATASRVDIVDTPAGYGIRSIEGLQIVNGGQTTASIHSAMVKDGQDLEGVFVQVKLTVVQPEKLNEIVPEISKFSNTQNKVTLVDFSSNDPFHVELEKTTRTLWAPAVDGSGHETKWFYERARGQYADALTRERTPARKRAFKTQFPTKQKFLKTDVAKWEHSWGQQPAWVSKGGEKNFRQFMSQQKGKPPTDDILYVKRLIARGILFRETERIVTAQQFGGYRANIVTYTIAKLSNETQMRVDLDRIWSEQTISEALADALEGLSHLVFGVIVSPPPGITNVGEWAKRDLCWSRVQEIQWSVPASLESELLDLSKKRAVASTDAKASYTEADKKDIEQVGAVAADGWFALSKWAKETGNLQGWQRSLAFSLGKVAARSAEPSIKQARQGAKILEEATALGFRP